MVDTHLQVQGYDTIFSAGDITEFIDDKTKTPAPTVAQVAEEQGRIAGINVLRAMRQKSLTPYVYRHFGYIVPLRGHFAVAELMGGIHFDGLWGWMLEQLVYLRYLLGILSIPKAFMRWNKFEMEMKM